ncbi:hypothetical protein BH10ACT9_BH10ACT9_29520 [soil metagenome]
MSALADLEARVAALEASHADYRAVLAAVNALGVNQREHSERLTRVDIRLDRVEVTLDDTNTRVRSLEDSVGEIKQLLVRALER